MAPSPQVLSRALSRVPLEAPALRSVCIPYLVATGRHAQSPYPQIWALAVGGAQESVMATGGGDARVVLWADSTEADQAAAAEAEEELAEKEQALQNALAVG